MPHKHELYVEYVWQPGIDRQLYQKLNNFPRHWGHQFLMGRSMLDRSLVLCAELVSCRLKREAFGMRTRLLVSFRCKMQPLETSHWIGKVYIVMSKYDDCHRVDNRYTTAIGMSVWRFFNIGKYKNQKVKDVCYFNPFYVAWCLESWQGFSLTSYERSNYMKGLERQLEKDPEDQELILKVSKCKTIVWLLLQKWYSHPP